MFLRVLPICVSLCAALISTTAQATAQQDAAAKLYCIVIANQKNRTRDFHYNLRSCPAGGGACFSKREPHILRNKGGPSTQGTVWCHVQRSPIELELTFDESDQDGYQERLDVLKPQTFAWRGLVPNIWCVGNAWFHFTSKRSGAGVAPGYPYKTQRGRCEWEEATGDKVVSAETGLPQSVIGSWVPKGNQCPGFFDDASRTGETLWVQPHAIERGAGSCWLTGKFNLGSAFTAGALCAAGKRYGRTDFTFDRIDGDTMRLREGRGRHITYKRCEKNWFLDPTQRKAADRLKGQTLSFVLDIEAQMRGVQDNKIVDGSHSRKIELQVSDDGTLTDRMQIGDSAKPKTFKARLGEIAVDSDGDRAGWLVEDDRLKRVRERKGYYEILSWPLNFDSRSVKCQAEMELAPTRADGKLRTVSTDRAEYDVIKAGIKSQRCPAEPLSFQVAAADKKPEPAAAVADKQTPSADTCILPNVERVKDSAKIRYELSLRNQCPVNLVVRVDSEDDEGLIITDLPGSAGRFQIGRTFGLTAAREASPKEFLEVLKFSVLAADDYAKSCPGIDIEETEKALACFDKVNGSANRQSEPSKQSPTSGQIIADSCVLATLPKSNEADDYKLLLLNKCAFPIMVAAAGWPNGVPFSVLSHLAANREFNPPGTGADAKTWNIKLGPKETPAQVLKNFAIQAVASDVFEKSCGTGKGDRASMQCFAAIQMKAILAKPASAADKDNSVEKPEPFDISEKPSPKEGNAKIQQQSSSASDANTCIVNKTIGKATPGAKSSHYLSVTNDCPFEPMVAVRGPWLAEPLITPVPSKDSGLSIGYSWDVNLPAGANPDESLKELEFAALSLEEFRRRCDVSVFDNDPGLRFQCFAGAYDEKYGVRDWSIPLWAKSGTSALEKLDQQATDKCIKTSMEKAGGGVGRYSVLSENTCQYGIVVRVIQPGTTEAAAAVLPPQSIRRLGVNFDRAIDTEAYLKRLEVSVLALEDYERTCGKFRDDDQNAALSCFGKAYVAKHGEPDWVKDARAAGGCVASDPDVAIKACTADIAAGKTDADTLNNRAVAYMQKGQFDLALPDLDTAIKRDPKHYGALSNRGIVLMKKKDYRRAIEDFSTAIELTPIAPLKPYRQRAEAYAAIGEHTKAWKDADEALKIDPKDDKARALKKASAHAVFGPGPGDWAEFQADSCSQSEDPDLRVNACLALIKEGKLGAEDLALAHVYIGQVAEAVSKKEFFAKRKESAQKNIRSALNQYALAIQADMKNPIGYAEIGNVLIAAKKYEQAEQWLRKGEQAAPTSRLICDRLVLLYERKGDSTARDKQNGRCEILPKDNPFRKIRVGSAQGKAPPSKEKSADATPPAKPPASQRFDTDEKVHVRHILLKSESDAELAAKALKGGADFAQTAKSLSTDEATAAKGGDLGWMARGRMLKAFEDAAFALKPGEISAPVKTQFGWHIIKLEERR